MDGQLTAVHIIGFVAQQVEKLGVDHGDQKVKGAVRIAHDKEQRRFPVAQLVQLQLIVHGGIPDFLNVEGREPGTAGNQDRFCGLSRNELSRTFYQKNKQQYYLLHYACCVCHLAV